MTAEVVWHVWSNSNNNNLFIYLFILYKNLVYNNVLIILWNRVQEIKCLVKSKKGILKQNSEH